MDTDREIVPEKRRDSQTISQMSDRCKAESIVDLLLKINIHPIGLLSGHEYRNLSSLHKPFHCHNPRSHRIRA